LSLMLLQVNSYVPCEVPREHHQMALAYKARPTNQETLQHLKTTRLLNGLGVELNNVSL